MADGLHLLDDGLVGGVGLDGELVGAAGNCGHSLGDLHHVAAVAEVVYIFFQNDFHGTLLKRICNRHGICLARTARDGRLTRTEIAGA